MVMKQTVLRYATLGAEGTRMQFTHTFMLFLRKFIFPAWAPSGPAVIYLKKQFTKFYIEE
jgi:hypothetical protein